LLSATVREDGYELSLTVTFALRGGSGPDPNASYSGLPTGNVREAFGTRKGVRRSSLARYGSQESLGKFTSFDLFVKLKQFFSIFLQVYPVARTAHQTYFLYSHYCSE